MTLENLAAGATDSMSYYYTKQSRANVLSHLRQLSIFCVAFHETFLPVSRLALLGFIELMSRTCKFEHIEHIISSVKFLHNFSGIPFVGDAFEFKILQRGLKRKLAKSPRQVLPITPEILLAMYGHFNIEHAADLAHWTAFLLALRLLYRKSSIAPESLSKFNPVTGLSREKVVLSNGVLFVFQNFSKTNQFMATTRTTPIAPGSIQALDPVFHYEKLISENVVPVNSPAFSYLNNGVIKCVTHRSFSSTLKSALFKIGLNPDLWSGHSFRRGGATLLYRLGIDPLTIQAVGDWSSETYLRYLEINVDRLWSAQVAMASLSFI